MQEHIIVIHLNGNELVEIEQIRQQFDPLALEIKAHITLVFPFKSNLTTKALHAHIQQATQGISPFPVQLQTITGQDGRYLFLNVKQGKNQLIALHDKSYSDILKPYRHSFDYLPHVTIGRFQDERTFRKAFTAVQYIDTMWQTLIQNISIVLIGDNTNDTQEMIVTLS